MVLPAPGAEKAEVVLAALGPAQERGEVALELDLRAQAWGQVQRNFQPMFGRDLLEQLVDRARADLVEHGLLEGGNRVCHPWMGGGGRHGSASCHARPGKPRIEGSDLQAAVVRPRP